MRNDSKARDIFYGIVAVATLIVAIIGATLAYFSMTAGSNEGAVNATAAIVSVQYNDGQQVTAQADKLIPADFKTVVKNVYEQVVLTNSNEESNTCVDKNGRQVCSVYRFSVESEVSDRQIIAFLNTEYNGFTYLNYAVYDVTNNEWIQLTDDGSEQMNLDSCNNENEETEDDCYNISGTRKTYSVNDPTAMNSMFGYTIDQGLTANRGRPLKGGTQTYDLILFIQNIDEDQNMDQGQNYKGTIMVEIQDGGTGGAGNIQGEW